MKPNVFTFVLVGIQEVLELGVEDLQVFLDEDLLTLPGQLVLGGLVEVNLHTPLLLQQTSLRLTEDAHTHGKTTVNNHLMRQDHRRNRNEQFYKQEDELMLTCSLRSRTFFMYSVTGFCCRNSVLSRV